MTHRALNRSALVAAAAALCALLVCFYPKSALAVLAGGGADLTVSAGGQVLDGPDGDALLSTLAGRSCVRLPGLPASPGAGDIRLCCGDMCAVITPGGGYLQAAGGDTYLIMDAGPELYRAVQALVTRSA